MRPARPSGKDPSKTAPSLKFLISIAGLLGITVAIGLVLWTGVGAIVQVIHDAAWTVVLVVLLRAIALAVAGLGWFCLFPRDGERPSLLQCIWFRLLREGAISLLPTAQIGGEAIGARALVLNGVSGPLAVASIIVDVLLQAGTQFLFAIAGLATLAVLQGGSGIDGTIVIIVVIAAPVLGAFYVLQRPAGRRFLTGMLRKAAGNREWLSFGTIDAVYDRLDRIYAGRLRLLVSLLVHASVWLIGALEVWGVLAALGYPVTYAEALVIESLMHAIRGAAFAIPGALGAQEGALVVLCALFGVPGEVAIAMSLIKRVPDFVLGLPPLLGWQVMEGRALRARTSSQATGPG